MKWLLLAAMLVIGGVWLLSRTSLGVRAENEVRALSDRLMISSLRLTSEFESES